MGCRISAALAMLRAVRPLRNRARFLTVHAYDYDQTRTIDAERDAGFGDLANSRPRCAQALRGRGSPSHALRGAGGQPEGEDQFALEGEDSAMRSTRPAHRACREGRVATQTLILEGESGALANFGCEMAPLGERGRTREPGHRRMSARTIRTAMRTAEPPAQGPSCQTNARAIGLHRGERPRSGLTPPDCVPHLFPFGSGLQFGAQDSACVWTAGPGGIWVGVRPRAGCVAVAGPPAEAVARGGLAVLLQGPGCRAWYRIRRTRLNYASHSSSNRTDMAAAWMPVPGGDHDDGHYRTIGVLGHRSGCGSGCPQVGRHHRARFRALARIQRRVVTGQEHGCLDTGCTGKPLAAFASPATPRMRLARAGSAFERPPGREGTAGSDLGQCACVLGHLTAASRRSAGGFSTFFGHCEGRPILFTDFSRAFHLQRPQISSWARRFRPAAEAGRKDGMMAHERSEDMASVATVKRLGPSIRNPKIPMGLNNLPIRCGCPKHPHQPNLFGSITHKPNEPCPFDDYGTPVGAFGSCCALRGQAAVSELRSLGEDLLAQGMYKDMSCVEAMAFARELRMAADRIEQEHAGDTTLEYEEQWDFEATLATIRTTARWYEKVANLGLGALAWN
jgi:hypothetical protein